MLEEIVAQNLAELRKDRGWTQAELAEKLGYSGKSVSKWERGEALPDLKVLYQMSELFDVSLDCFVTENALAECRKNGKNAPKNELGFRDCSRNTMCLIDQSSATSCFAASFRAASGVIFPLSMSSSAYQKKASIDPIAPKCV